jgi:two-component system, NtrC family, response regulator HydG
MSHSLIAIAGPLSGTTLPLGKAAVSIGRDDGNAIMLADSGVALHHCVLECAGNVLTIRDLDASNPTFLNGLSSGNASLQDGDRLQIGVSVFIVKLGTSADIPGESVRIEANAPSTSSAMVMRREDVFSDKRTGRHKSPERLARDLGALIRITAAINAVRGLAGLERPLLELVADVIPARRGAVIMSSGSEITSSTGWSRDKVRSNNVALDKTVVERVLKEIVGVLNVESASPAPSSSHGRSILAAPLVAFDALIGAIVFETDSADEPFDEDHLRLLMAIAGNAATALEHARQVERLEGENQRLQAELDLDHNMIGQSAPMLEVYRRIARVSPTNATVLITGESGTGKELVARAIHRNSPRSSRPFVAINCAAITETLLESELFGHEKGAFTGAIASKKGKLETAEGGTVFLDEIGELSPALQAKMLRVLQEREFERVGGTRSVQVDFRLIAATNRDLEAAIEAGQFRRDLYYRLNVVTVGMPPLNERRDDIPLLAVCFARRHAEKSKRVVSGLSPEALSCLGAYAWPGNVRELENAIEHAVLLGSTSQILPEDLPDAIAESKPGAAISRSSDDAGFHEAVKETKKDLIIRAVERAGGNYNAAARLLGLHPNYLHRLIKNLQIKSALKHPSDR